MICQINVASPLHPPPALCTHFAAILSRILSYAFSFLLAFCSMSPRSADSATSRCSLFWSSKPWAQERMERHKVGTGRVRGRKGFGHKNEGMGGRKLEAGPDKGWEGCRLRQKNGGMEGRKPGTGKGEALGKITERWGGTQACDGARSGVLVTKAWAAGTRKDGGMEDRGGPPLAPPHPSTLFHTLYRSSSSLMTHLSSPASTIVKISRKMNPTAHQRMMLRFWATW